MRLIANDSVVVNDSYEKAEDYAKAIGLTVTAQNTAETPKVFRLAGGKAWTGSRRPAQPLYPAQMKYRYEKRLNGG